MRVLRGLRAAGRQEELRQHQRVLRWAFQSIFDRATNGKRRTGRYTSTCFIVVHKHNKSLQDRSKDSLWLLAVRWSAFESCQIIRVRNTDNRILHRWESMLNEGTIIFISNSTGGFVRRWVVQKKIWRDLRSKITFFQRASRTAPRRARTRLARTSVVAWRDTRWEGTITRASASKRSVKISTGDVW